MMKKIIFYFFTFSLLLFSHCSLAIENPVMFLNRIYDGYSNDGFSVPAIDQTGQQRIASSRFIGVLKEGQELTLPGDAFLDYDPICQCQDYQNLVVTNITVLFNNEKFSHVSVTLRPFSTNSDSVTVTFNLVSENAKWYIDDIFDVNGKSVRDAIDADNKIIRLKGGRN